MPVGITVPFLTHNLGEYVQGWFGKITNAELKDQIQRKIKESRRNMDFDIHLHIPENSQQGQIIQALAADQQITPQEAAQRVFNEGLKLHVGGSPASRMIGLFSSPEDLAVMEEVDKLIAENRQSHTSREIGL